MLIDRTHHRWFIISLALFVAGSVSYVIYARAMPNGPSGGSIPGLIYGIIGTAMMIFAGLLAGRRTLRNWPLGNAQFWLRGHLWLGTLSVPFILFHAGFGWGGLVENLLWITFGIVVVSGFIGLAIQQVVPRLITARVPRETFIGQHPYQTRRMLFLADQMVSETCGAISLNGSEWRDTFSKLTSFYAGASRDEKAEWIEHVPANSRTLFRDLALHCKGEGWIRTEDDFPSLLPKLYTELAGDDDKPAAAKPAKGKGQKAAKASPLEAARAQAAGKPKAAGGKKSPLEMAREQAGQPAKQGAKKSPLELAREQAGQPAKKTAKKSPLELAREQAGQPAKKTEKKSPLELAREQAGQPTKKTEKKSPLELAREQAGQPAKKAEKKSPLELAREQAGQPAKKTEKKSPLELAREQAGQPAKKGGKKSPLELAREQDGKGGQKTAGKSPLELAREQAGQPAKKGTSGKAAAGGSAAPTTLGLSPDQIKVEQDKIRKHFTGQYGYSDQVADKLATQTTPFLAPPPEPEPKAPTKKSVARKTAPPVKPETKKAEVIKEAPVPQNQIDRLRRFYTESVRPFLSPGRVAGSRLEDAQQAARLFAQMRTLVPAPAMQRRLEQLATLCDERRGYLQQGRLHRLLHWWLMLHIPVSIALAVLFVAHVIVSLRVIPFF